MNEQKLNIGDRIVSLRKAAGLERGQLAEQIEIEYQTLAKYETNLRTPGPETVNKFARFFNVTTDYLLGLSDKPHEYPRPEPQIIKEPKLPPDLRKVIDDAELHLDGVPLTDEDREKLHKAIELLFWDAKKQNKRKKS